MLLGKTSTVQIVRVYTGSDGETHFEDLTQDQFAEIAKKGTGPIILNRRSSPFVFDNHNSRQRLYIVNMSGIGEYEVSDGTVRRLSPGDVLVTEDLTGRGHISRGVGDEFRVSLAIPLADE